MILNSTAGQRRGACINFGIRSVEHRKVDLVIN